MSEQSGLPILQTHEASIGYGARLILRKLDFAVPEAAFTVLLGPNGCGKSTLLRALAGLIRPQHGSVLMNGRSISTFGRRELAQRVGLLLTNITPSKTVLETVAGLGGLVVSALLKGGMLARADNISFR